MLVAVQLLVPGLYLPPVFNGSKFANPPQTIISVPVHTAVLPPRASGALTVLITVQLLVPRLYLPPEVSPLLPQTIISVPVHTAV